MHMNRANFYFDNVLQAKIVKEMIFDIDFSSYVKSVQNRYLKNMYLRLKYIRLLKKITMYLFKYRGADKSLARPTSQCILIVRIFRLMIVWLHI